MLSPPSPKNAKNVTPAPDFKNGYTLPKTQTPQLERDKWHNALDLMVLAGFLSVATHLIYTRRSRKATLVLTLAGLIYFGFYREGCVCPVGSIQNVAMSAGGNGYPLPWTLAVIFTLPLIFSLFYGRVFCSGVCPLGAIQDVVLFKAVKVPPWVEVPLGLFAFAYLGMGVLFAWTGSDFVICKYDPFVGLFRLSGPAHMIVLGGVILLLWRFCWPGLLPVYLPLWRAAAAPLQVLTTSNLHHPPALRRLPTLRRKLPLWRHPRAAAGAQPQCREREKANHRRRRIDRRFDGWFCVHSVTSWRRVSRGSTRAWSWPTRLATNPKPATPASTTPSKPGETPAKPRPSFINASAMSSTSSAFGLPIFGIWMGMSIGGRILGMLVKRRQTGYSADGSACVACARCYADCPIETGEAAS